MITAELDADQLAENGELIFNLQEGETI